MTYQSSSSRDTEQFAARLARRILRTAPRTGTSPKASARQGRASATTKRASASRRRATIVALSGELGGGKTTFTRGFARGLGARGRVQSPTFIIIRRMMIKRMANSKEQMAGGKKRGTQKPYAKSHMPFANLYHMDAYRISKQAELGALGLREVLREPKNILLIEWPEKYRRHFGGERFGYTLVTARIKICELSALLTLHELRTKDTLPH